MEQAEHIEEVVNKEVRVDRVLERDGWMILSTSAVSGIVAAVVTIFPPLYVFSSSLNEGVYPMKGTLGTALVDFNSLAPVIA